MNILAIESSCDETAAAVVSGEKTPELLSNVVVSQIDIFKEYGGVIPEVAARSHLEAILPVIHKAMADAHKTWDDIDYIAVTHTPGLLGSLLIGTLTARTLAILHNKPLYAVHHLKSHIYANWLGEDDSRKGERDEVSEPVSRTAYGRSETSSARDDGPEREWVKKPASHSPSFPFLALVISGGHTQIIRMTKHNHFEIIGTTLDDAVGECFDKVAKILGLPYPGGPSIAKAAEKGDPKKYPLPHPKIKGLDFSFSGLKTAVLRAVQKEVGVPISFPSHELKNKLTEAQVADFAASFEDTAVDILLEKLQQAYKMYPDTKSIVLAGGVSANERLRKKAAATFAHGLRKASAVTSSRGHKLGRPAPWDAASVKRDTPLSVPSEDGPALAFPKSCFSGDNAAMVGAAAFYEIKTGVQKTDPFSLDISPRSVIQ